MAGVLTMREAYIHRLSYLRALDAIELELRIARERALTDARYARVVADVLAIRASRPVRHLHKSTPWDLTESEIAWFRRPIGGE